MFFTINLLAFIHLDGNFNYPNEVGKQYVFLEDAQDIVNIHGSYYQNENQINRDNMNVSVSVSRIMFYRFVELYNTLKRTIKFSSKLNTQPNGEVDVFLGKSNVLLAPASFIAFPRTLFPTYSFYDRIWVKGAIHQESPIYFLYSFDLNLWLAFLTIFLVCITATLLIQKLMKRTVPTFDIISLILNQGVGDSPSKLISYKIILFSLSVMLIIFHGGFEAFLSSLLAIKKSILPFHDFNSLLEQNEYTLCLRRTATVYEITKYEKQFNPNFKVNINEEICPLIFRAHDYHRYSIGDPIHAACHNDKVVFMSPGIGHEFLLFSKQCGISPISGRYIKQQSSLTVNPGFKYKKQFNKVLIRMRTAGILQNIQLREMLDMKRYYGSNKPYHLDNGIHPITFHHIHLVLVLFLGIGVILTLIILLVEIIFKHLP